jgi:hypothetical protein
MKAHQLFHAISKDLQTEIVGRLDREHAGADRMVLATLAAQRKLRPVFLERKPKPEQIAWVSTQLGARVNNGLAEQVLQVWLLKSQQGMLKTFLDAVGIEHKDGEVDSLPDEIAPEKAKAGIDALLSSESGDKAAVYLHMFQMQRSGGWESLTKAIADEPRLQLTVAA